MRGAEIRYKRSNNLKGPMIILPIDKVLSIKYENGVTDIVNAPSVQGNAGTGISGSSGGQPVSMSAVLQASLNAMPAIPIAGNNLKFLFNGSTWTATLNGGTISNNTVSGMNSFNGAYSAGGGVYVRNTGKFVKEIGAIIYGYDPSNQQSNAVKNGDNILDKHGHAVYVDITTPKYKDNTADSNLVLFYDGLLSSSTTISSGWDNDD